MELVKLNDSGFGFEQGRIQKVRLGGGRVGKVSSAPIATPLYVSFSRRDMMLLSLKSGQATYRGGPQERKSGRPRPAGPIASAAYEGQLNIRIIYHILL